VGKTELSLQMAEELGGEIVSADSMQVYRGMDIGTAKPTAEERLRVPHHMIDVVDPDEDYSVARYAEEATRCIADVHARGKLPMLVGGTGFYVQAVVDGLLLPDAPPNPALRESLREQARRDGVGSLHNQLSEVDAVSAGRIHPNDVKRVIRALEIYHATNRPASSFGSAMQGSENAQSLDRSPCSRYNSVILGLTRHRDQLYERIERRVDEMLAAHLLDEVRGLVERGCHRGMTSMQGLGYRQALTHLTYGTDLDAEVNEWKRDTRRFAKRQWTWFRRDIRIHWIEMTDKRPGDVLGELAGSVKRIYEG